jgi:hypothetical protein
MQLEEVFMGAKSEILGGGPGGEGSRLEMMVVEGVAS